MKHKSAIVIFHGYRWSLRMILASLFLAGFVLGLTRLFLPTIVEYRPDIELLAQDILQAPVTIGDIETGWHGLTPVISLKHIEIEGLSKDTGSVVLQSLDIAINPITSLLAWELRPSEVVLKMHELSIKRLQDGTFNFTLGYKDQSEDDLLDRKTLNWLFEQPDLHIEISRIDFGDETLALPQMVFSNIDLIFKKEIGDVIASFNATVANIADKVHAIVRLNDVVGADDIPEAQMYIQLGGIDLDAIRNIAKGQYGLPDSGQVSLELWADFREGKLEKMQGDWLASNVFFAASKEMSAFKLDSFKTGFIWERASSGWKLELAGLQIGRANYQWPETTMLVDLQIQDGTRRYLINSNYMRLDDLLPIAWHQPALSKSIKDKLINMSPSGELNKLQLQLTYGEGKFGQYGFQVDIKDLSFNADGEFPGITGLDGYVAATEQAGLFRINTLDAQFHLPTLFRKPLPLDLVDGTISWSRLDDGLLIEFPELLAENSHIKTKSRLSIHWPDEGSPFVDLQTNFRDGDGSHTSLYLPAYVLDDDALQWLDKAIVSGFVEYGTFVLHGALADFPFDQSNGKFEVRFKVRNGILDYYENWPVIDEIEAEVVFSGRGMRIEAAAGKIFGADIQHTVVEIPDLDADNPMLGIRGAVKTSSTDLMRYLQDAQLTGDYQAALSLMSLKGDHRLNLNLNIPLSTGDPHFDGSLDFTGNELEIPSWRVALKGVQGRLDFTENKFEANDIKADFSGYMTHIDISTQYVSKGRETHIQANTQADISNLLRQGSEQLAGLMQGVSPVQVDIVVPDYVDGASRLVASSTLLGTAINLPPPLGKGIDTELPLTVATGFEGEASRRIDIELGEQSRAVLAVSNKGSGLEGLALYFGEISFADLYARAKDSAYVGGRIESLPLDEWLEWYGSLSSGKRSADTFPVLTDIQIGELRYAKWFVKDLAIQTHQSVDNWVMNLSGNGAAGKIVMPATGSGSIEVDLAELSLYKQEEQKGDAVKAGDRASGLVPADIPSLELKIDKMYYQARELGRLSADIRSKNNMMDIKDVVLKNPETETKLAGSWSYVPKINQHETLLRLTQTSKDFGNFLSRHGFEDTIKRGRAEVTANFSAGVALPDLSSKSLSGKARFDLDKGEIVEIDPGGVGRVFGLLSFQALPRRLILDFRDLFSEGMSFDDIDGNFTFSNGEAYTNNLIMEAPSSRIEVSGRIGLADEDYDQLVKVIPKVSSTLPVAGALAGGPGLAAVMYLTHKLFKDPINKLTEAEYRVTGSWRDPKVTPLDGKVQAEGTEGNKDKVKTGAGKPDSL